MTPVKIVTVYQPLLGIYSDQGNARVLVQRLRWRGIDAVSVFADPGEPLPVDGAVYLLGGGEDRAQITAAREILRDGRLFRALDDGAMLFAVCAGYQICGRTFTIGGGDRGTDTVVDGLGLLDIETRRGPKRAVGEILTTWTRDDGSHDFLTGFENHGGCTTLGPDAAPLARTELGVGNNGSDGTEGAMQGQVIGTYLHGPVLARNPALADHVLERALGEPLPPLDRAADELAHLRQQRIAAARRLQRSTGRLRAPNFRRR